MNEKDYYYWQGRLSVFDDLSDGAWWASCENAIGGYDKFMSYLEASKIYDAPQKTRSVKNGLPKNGLPKTVFNA